MSCAACGSEGLGSFPGETTIHHPGLRDVKEPPVYVSHELVVCLACGATQFVVPGAELHRLTKVTPPTETHQRIGFRFP